MAPESRAAWIVHGRDVGNVAGVEREKREGRGENAKRGRRDHIGGQSNGARRRTAIERTQPRFEKIHLAQSITARRIAQCSVQRKLQAVVSSSTAYFNRPPPCQQKRRVGQRTVEPNRFGEGTAELCSHRAANSRHSCARSRRWPNRFQSLDPRLLMFVVCISTS